MALPLHQQFALNRLFVVSTNLGSVFESVEIEENWLREFDKVVLQADPDLVALHCQEIGGKEFTTSMHKVEEFVRRLRGLPCFVHFDRVRGMFDTAFKDSEEFTALGSVYFLHKRVEPVFLFDFDAKDFSVVLGEQVEYTRTAPTGSSQPFFSKERFPNHYYPDVKWSRKGFIHSRWKMFGSYVLNFVNIHLFHDDDNLVALEKSPSVYCGYRRNAMDCCLHSVTARLRHPDEPVFIFGDFNFRLDCSAVVKHIATDHETQMVRSDNGRVDSIIYVCNGKASVSIERKRFKVADEAQFTEKYSELLQYDLEPKDLSSMMELPVTFAPSYPFAEVLDQPGNAYMDKRCPAWCDRILMSEAGLRVVQKSPLGCMYNMMAKEVCVGDHKPIYLFFTIPSTTAMKQFTDDNSDA